MILYEHRNEFEFETQAETTDGGGFHELLELFIQHGFEGMAQAIRTLWNEAMRLERSQVLGARPNERTKERRGYGNGFKPKTAEARVGRLELRVPKARGVEFYPSSLERGLRSERALKVFGRSWRGRALPGFDWH